MGVLEEVVSSLFRSVTVDDVDATEGGLGTIAGDRETAEMDKTLCLFEVEATLLAPVAKELRKEVREELGVSSFEVAQEPLVVERTSADALLN